MKSLTRLQQLNKKCLECVTPIRLKNEGVDRNCCQNCYLNEMIWAEEKKEGV